MTPRQQTASQAAHEAYQDARSRRGMDGAQAFRVALRVYQSVIRDGSTDRAVPVAARVMFLELVAPSGLTMGQLWRGGRLRWSKQLAFDEALLVLREWPLPYAAIGSLVHRDHSSVMAAVRRARARMETDEVMRLRVARLTGEHGETGEAERRRAVGG